MNRALAQMIAFLLVCCFDAHGQESNYRRIDVDHRLLIDVPTHWYEKSEAERRNIGAAGEAIAGTVGAADQSNYYSSLSVSSLPLPSAGIVRVSFVRIEELKQTDFMQAVNSDKDSLLRDLDEFWKSECRALSRGLQVAGMVMLECKRAQVERVGNVTAMVFAYRRTSVGGEAPFLVTQYHIPLGKKKALVTLSYRESEAGLYRVIMDRVKRSIVVR